MIFTVRAVASMFSAVSVGAPPFLAFLSVALGSITSGSGMGTATSYSKTISSAKKVIQFWKSGITR